MRANASKRRQTRTNASKRRGETQANASKREQTWTNANKRLHPPLLQLFTPRFAIPLYKDQKINANFFVQSFSRTLWVMDARAENHGHPPPKVGFPAAPVMGRNFLDPWASGRKGQECPQEIRTKKFMFMLLFLHQLRWAKWPIANR